MNYKIKEIYDKINLTGTGMNTENEYYLVAGISVHYIKQTDSYKCTCKDCTITRIPNNLPSRCDFVRALKQYRKCHIK